MSVLLRGMLDGIMKRFGNSWLREFDEEWRGDLVLSATFLVFVMNPNIHKMAV